MANPHPSLRNMQIYRASVLDEITTFALADQYGVTAPRISQIVHRVGETRHGKHLTIVELREKESKVGAVLPELPPL